MAPQIVMAGPAYLNSASIALAIWAIMCPEAIEGVFGIAELEIGGIAEYANTSTMSNNNSISAKLAAILRSPTCLERKNRNSVDAASSAESSSSLRTHHARHRVRNSPRRLRDSLPVFPPASLVLIFAGCRFEAFG